MTPAVSAVVLAYGEEPYLEAAVRAVLASDIEVEVVVVDNGASPPSIEAVAGLAGVRLVRPAENTGYAGGCRIGAAEAAAPVLAFVNSDALVAPDCLRLLAEEVSTAGVGPACAGIRLADHPEQMNSVGNPVHYLYFSWAGGFGEPAAEHNLPGEVSSISGATFAITRELWDRLGGFDEEYFAYGEDVDLSIRSWQLGYPARFVPQAVAWHHYEFSRNPLKMYLLERNRLINLITLPEPRTRRRLGPICLAVEAGMLAVSLRDGWSRQKIDGWRWLWRHRDYLRQRRRRVQSMRLVSDDELEHLFSDRFAPAAGLGVSVPEAANNVLQRYAKLWRRRPATSLGGTSR